jgi:heme/copper-type cytochrome/quinol oxidase subunit 1
LIVYILIIPYFTLITDTPQTLLNRDILSDTLNKRSIALVGTKIFVHGITGG